MRSPGVASGGLEVCERMKFDFLYRITKTMTVTNEDDDAPHSFYVPFQISAETHTNDLQERKRTLVLRCSLRFLFRCCILDRGRGAYAWIDCWGAVGMGNRGVAGIMKSRYDHNMHRSGW